MASRKTAVLTLTLISLVQLCAGFFFAFLIYVFFHGNVWSVEGILFVVSLIVLAVEWWLYYKHRTDKAVAVALVWLVVPIGYILFL